MPGTGGNQGLQLQHHESKQLVPGCCLYEKLSVLECQTIVGFGVTYRVGHQLTLILLYSVAHVLAVGGDSTRQGCQSTRRRPN